MKTDNPGSFGSTIGRNRVLAALALGAVCATAVNAADPVQPTGYLNRSAPPGLRFAEPAKPPVAPLPPLGITHDPQPAWSPQFVPQTGASVNVKTTQIQATNELPVEVEGLTAKSNSQILGKHTSIPDAPEAMSGLSARMLVKFFQNGQPAGVAVVGGGPVGFEPPLRTRPSSTATYEVK